MARAHRQLEEFAEALLWAQNALDVIPEGLDALVNGAYANLGLGDAEAAYRMADRARLSFPTDERAWGAHLLASAFSGSPTLPAPAGVRESTHYRIQEARVALDLNHVSEADTIVADLMQAGHQSATILNLRATAALRLAIDGTTPATDEQVKDVVRWTTDILETWPDEKPEVQRALSLRASAHRRLGDAEGEAADIERLAQIDPNDAQALHSRASELLTANKREEALALLGNSIVDHHAELLALRANAAAALDRYEIAQADAEAAERLLATSGNPVMVRLQIAEVALAIGELSWADRLVETASAISGANPLVALLSARIAWERGVLDEAVKKFGSAAEAAPTPQLRTDILVELAHRHLSAGSPNEAIQAFDAAGEDALPQSALSAFAQALVAGKQFERCEELLERTRAKGVLPEWALKLAVIIAEQRDAPEEEVVALKELLTVKGDDIRLHFALIAHCLELGRLEEAQQQLEQVTLRDGLTPLERSQCALFWSKLGEADRAIELAFAAYRDAPGEVDVVRTFIGVTFVGDGQPRHVDAVAPNTFVELRDENGRCEPHFVYDKPPIARQSGEWSVEDAEKVGVLGLREGDEVTWRSPGWEKRLVISRVMPAEQYAVQEAAAHFAERFPREPFFVAAVPMGVEGSVGYLAPLIASAHQRRRFVGAAMTAAVEQKLPLGTVAQLIGATVPDVMDNIVAFAPKASLQVEWPRMEDQLSVIRMLALETDIVIDRAALYTLHKLHHLKALSSAFRVHAPRALLTALDAEVREAETAMRDGVTVLAATLDSIQQEHTAAGSPVLARRLEAAREQRDWLVHNAIIEARPLRAVSQEADSGPKLRETIGAAAYDAAILAHEHGAMLLVDDLVLRHLDLGDGRLRACSTITMLYGLAERGAIDTGMRDRSLLRLLALGYATIAPTVDLLVAAISEGAAGNREIAARAFQLLGAAPTLKHAANLLIQVLRSYASVRLQVVSTAEVCALALAGMARMWPMSVVTTRVAAEARAGLQLLPLVEAECLAACRQASNEADLS
jgi:tetratricopeptide (TPR) repeat protein